MQYIEKINYLGQYSEYGNIDIINEKIKEYTDQVLRMDLHTANVFLCKLRDSYHYNNYMYILESICNYLVKIYAELRKEYIYQREYGDYEILSSIKERYDNVRKVYDFFAKKNINNTNNVVNFQQYKKERIRKYS